MAEASEQALNTRYEVAIKWFELHAAQRLTLLSAYLAASGFIIAGIGGAFSGAMPAVASALSLALGLFTWVFSSLDARTRQLIKVGEAELHDVLKARGAVSEGGLTIVDLADKKERGVLSYRKSFLVLYAAMYLISAGSLWYSLWPSPPSAATNEVETVQ